MTVVDRFRTALFHDEPGSLDTELLPSRLAKACAQALPASGAGISLIDQDFRVPLGGSDEVAGYAERLQFTLGEGPCLEAYESTDPVSVSEQEILARWPLLYADLVANTPYRAIISLPLLRSEPGHGGAIDLYLSDPEQAAAVVPEDARVVSETVGALLSLSAATATQILGPAWLDGDAARRRKKVWVAIGIISVQCDTGAPDALALLRGFAYQHGRSLDDLAQDIVEGAVTADQLRPA